MTETFIKDLFNFANKYTDKYVVAIINKANVIADNSMLCDMLHELALREKAELERFEKEFTWVMKNCDDINKVPDNHFETYRHDCLQHAQSYRDVIRDYVWELLDIAPF